MDAQGADMQVFLSSLQGDVGEDKFFRTVKMETQDLPLDHDFFMYETPFNEENMTRAMQLLGYDRCFCEFSYATVGEMDCLYERRGHAFRSLW